MATSSNISERTETAGTGTARAAFYLTFASAVSILFSIAVSQILMALALAILLISGERLLFPPIKLPLGLFFLGTIVAVLLSADPAAGTPQIRKFFVFTMLLLIASTFRTVAQIRLLLFAWSGVAVLSALLSLVQFVQRYERALEDHAATYDFYLARRITGFASHWMTLGGEEMVVLLVLTSWLLFSRPQKGKVCGWLVLPVLFLSIVLGFTRSIFLLGVPVGVAYLLWQHKPRLLVWAAVLTVIALIISPLPLRQRVISVLKPHGTLDSNQNRVTMRRTGWEMVKAHPWFGVGPEQVKPQFYRYLPADISRPLPAGWYGHLHNVYLQYAAERGVPAMLLMMWVIGKILYDLRQALAKQAGGIDARFVLHGAVAVVLAILAEGFFEYNLGDSEVLTMFLAVIGCAYVAAGESNGIRTFQPGLTRRPAKYTSPETRQTC